MNCLKTIIAENNRYERNDKTQKNTTQSNTTGTIRTKWRKSAAYFTDRKQQSHTKSSHCFKANESVRFRLGPKDKNVTF